MNAGPIFASHAEGDLTIWYIPQVPMQAFRTDVPDLATGKYVLEAIYEVAAFEFLHNVKPDYSNAGGISRWEPDGEGGMEWADVDESEWESL